MSGGNNREFFFFNGHGSNNVWSDRCYRLRRRRFHFLDELFLMNFVLCGKFCFRRGFNGGLFDGVGIGGSPTFNLTGGTLQWVTSNPFVIKDSSQGGGFPIFFNVGGTGILKTPSYGYKGTGPYSQVTFNLNGGTW